MAAKVARRGGVPPFIVMDVMRAADERAAAGARVLHLEVGQPSTPAPLSVREAALRAVSTDRLGYTGALGLPALRQRIAQHYADCYGVVVNWRQVVITTGSSGAFVLAFLAAFDAGDRVAIAAPGYPAYRNILAALGIEVVSLPVDADSRFQPTPAMLEALDDRPQGLIVASPANPTGSMLDEISLRALASWCQHHGVRLISDEIYHGITYGMPAGTALSSDPSAIVVNSFSKYYSMTGWRLGWMVLPEALVRPVECLAQNLFIAPPSVSQHAAIAAFDCVEELDANVARYARNRALLLDGLPQAGFRRLAPADGAFYLYAELDGAEENSIDLTARMLAEADVAATPGVDFDPVRGHRFVRFCFAGSEQDMAEAVERLIAWRA